MAAPGLQIRTSSMLLLMTVVNYNLQLWDVL